MKKILSLAMTTFMIFTFQACSSEGDGASVNTGADGTLDLNELACHNNRQSSSSIESSSSISDTTAIDTMLIVSSSSAISSSSEVAIDSTCDQTIVEDEYTLYFFGLDEQQEQGTLVKGKCGNALLLSKGESVILDADLVDTIAQGTIEFWFNPSIDFFTDGENHTLLGNDGSRLHFFYSAEGELYFQKNQSDVHIFTSAFTSFSAGEWYHIAGQWGNGYVSLYVNDSLVSQIANATPYTPSPLTYRNENELRIGIKSYCCMEGAGFYQGMSTSGTFDQVRISNILRYQ
jgi:hypothetical protein